VRAAARGALVALGPGAIDELRPLARSSSPAVRAAAVSALLDLGDDEWLAAELLDRPAD
jgi:HEAT repeat protein